MKLRLGVIFGGESVEHEVAVISALQAINSIDREKYDVVPVYIAKNRIWYTGKDLLDIKNFRDIDLLLTKVKPVTLCRVNNEYVLMSTKGMFNKIVDKIDVAFPIVHGKNVEDGSLAGYLDTVGVPYVGSTILGSALGQDKVVLKDVLKANDIPVVDSLWFYDNEYLLDKDKVISRVKKMGLPVVVKPACLGSSVGITFVKDESKLEEAIDEAVSYDKKVLIEKAVSNLVEVNCSVLGNYENQEPSVIEEVMSDNDILTFSDKYEGNSKSKGASKGMVNTDRIIPARIDKDLIKKIEDLSVKTFKVLNLSGVVRIDYLIDTKTKNVYVNEPNIIPGSLAFYLWEAKGKKYTELLDDLVKLAIKDYKAKEKKTCSFDTNILKNFDGSKGTKK